jgi:hypothetical protein
MACEDKRKETVQIIGELIADWVLPMVISSVTDNADGTYTLEVDKTYYLQKGKRRKITITIPAVLDEEEIEVTPEHDVEYTILEVVNNTQITVSGDELPVASTIILPPPYFFHGTILQTNTELKKEKDIWRKTPMIFLQRPFSETLNNRAVRDSDIANTAALTFRFLTEANWPEWSTDDHDLHAVVPMRNMLYEFVALLNSKERFVQRFEESEATDLIRFGLITQKGYEAGGLFSDNYSGVQQDITLGLKYQCVCPD